MAAPKKSGNPRAQVKSAHSLEGIDTCGQTFEKMFLSRAYFLGEVELDPSVLSLIHLDESLEELILPNGRTILMNRSNIEKKVKTLGSVLFTRYQSLKDQKDFDLYSFLIENDVKTDKICGTFPLVFEDYRLVSHALRMAWAFYLTLRMHKMNEFSFPQRMRSTKKKSLSFKIRRRNHLSCIFTHLLSSFKNEKLEDEKSIIKCLKNSLCYHVSESLDQEELPEGIRINLVPFQFRSYFNKLPKTDLIRFYFSLLQSKVLCKEVPDSFIQDTLEKHRNQLSSPTPSMDPEILDRLKERGREFGKRVVKYYQPTQGFLPTNKATFAFPRNRGGVKGDLVYHDCLRNSDQGSKLSNERMEPMVIGFFGQPGQGKSSILPQLICVLSKLFPGVKRSEMTYSRTCNTDHWDGYQNQPIVILDDLGQSKSGEDIKEFQTLVSCNPYVLPMADLSEKGKHFTSPIIICTSNLVFGSKLNYLYTDSAGIIDDTSFWRRFHIPFYVENKQLFQLKEQPRWVRHRQLLMSATSFRYGNENCGQPDPKTFFQDINLFTKKISGHGSQAIYKQDLWEACGQKAFDSLISEFQKRESFHNNIGQLWTQTIDEMVEDPSTLIGKEFFKEQISPFLPTSLGEDLFPQHQSIHTLMDFPAFPPNQALPVRVEPIVEPLKVRTITAGIGQTFCLKPFQRAMWYALGEEKQFCLTHGTNNLEPAIKRIYENSDSEDVWISGDYTAATDSIPIEASKALMEGILESIDHEPTKRWAMKEISPHILVYPKSSGLEPVLQRSGQLMGSLVSFPLLCLLNDCTARHIGLKSHQYLINGDDILMRTRAENYPRWKEMVQKFGLSLSLGKNYIHPRFGTVNSQLILEGEVLNSGKQKVLDRRSRILGECLRDLELLMHHTASTEVHALFKTINRQKLSRTVRSISVPVSHGGLSLNWGERGLLSDRSRKTELLVYLFDLFTKIEPENGCISIPYLSKTEYRQKSVKEMSDLFCDPVTSSEYHEEFIGHRALDKSRSRMLTHPQYRDLFFNQKIEDLPSLSFLKALQVPFNDGKVRKEIQQEIFRVFLGNFLDSNEIYNYDLFRSSFLHAVRGVPMATAVATKHLVSVIDLQVKPDYLKKVIKGFSCRKFHRPDFEETLKSELSPKKFNLPCTEGSPDFSKEVVQSFENLMSNLTTVENDSISSKLESLNSKELSDLHLIDIIGDKEILNSINSLIDGRS